jgi:hypothetical protein
MKAYKLKKNRLQTTLLTTHDGFLFNRKDKEQESFRDKENK